MQSSERPPGTRSARDGHPETRRGTACERRHCSRGIRRETNGYQESVSQSPPLRLPVRQVFMRCSSGHIWLPGTLLSALQGTWSFLNWAAKSRWGGRCRVPCCHGTHMCDGLRRLRVRLHVRASDGAREHEGPEEQVPSEAASPRGPPSWPTAPPTRFPHTPFLVLKLRRWKN